MDYKSLLRENVALKKENARLKKSYHVTEREKNRVLSETAEHAHLMKKNSYFEYVKEAFLSSTVYYIYDKVMNTFKPLIWVARGVRIILLILTYIQVSAVLLFSFVLVLCMLPIFAIVFLASFVFVYRDMRKQSKRLLSLIGKTPVVLFTVPSYTDDFFDTAYMISSMKYIVFCIFNSKIPRGVEIHPLSNVFDVADNVFIIRERFWFHIKKIMISNKIIIIN